MYIYILMTTD